jgi:hypothetical protein
VDSSSIVPRRILESKALLHVQPQLPNLVAAIIKYLVSGGETRSVRGPCRLKSGSELVSLPAMRHIHSSVHLSTRIVTQKLSFSTIFKHRQD